MEKIMPYDDSKFDSLGMVLLFFNIYRRFLSTAHNKRPAAPQRVLPGLPRLCYQRVGWIMDNEQCNEEGNYENESVYHRYGVVV
jgi:hypothetical protein